MKRILVTGGAGYIGSHTAKCLPQAGYTPIVYDNLSNGHRWAVRFGPFVEGDLADRDLLLDTLRAHEIDAVVHFAASAYVGESVRDPLKYFRNNTANTVTLLDAMREAEVQHIVFSSTCATYGVPETVPINEREAQEPINPYGESKLFVERVLRWAGEAHGLRWAALRYFNAAGADPDGEIGEVHDPETHLIPLAIQAGLGQRPPLKVFGTDYPTPDGTAVRDYIHVMDLGAAHIRALEYLAEGGDSVALNLGTGHGHSVRQVLDAVGDALGHPVPADDAPRRAGDPPALIADASLAHKVLQWQPKHSSLDTIVSTAVAWHKRQAAG
ncbi:MAG: UDP-glucose 4-epimerase GalE [Bacteroidota bacterium]